MNINKQWILIIVFGTGTTLFYFYKKLTTEDKTYQEIVARSYDGDAEDDFDMYVSKFYRDIDFFGIYPKKPDQIVIKFSDFDKIENATHIHGLTHKDEDSNRVEIYINQTSWDNFSKAMKYILMYHELAHAILDADDLEFTEANEGKLMYPNISRFEYKNMDDFIEMSHDYFDEISQ